MIFLPPHLFPHGVHAVTVTTISGDCFNVFMSKQTHSNSILIILMGGGVKKIQLEHYLLFHSDVRLVQLGYPDQSEYQCKQKNLL